MRSRVRGSRPARRAGLAAALLTLALPGAAFAAAGDPVLSGSVSDPVNLSGATATAVSGNYAYTTSYGQGRVTAVDISNPAAPTIAGTTGFRTSLLNASTINIVGTRAYVVSKNRNASRTSNDDGSGNSLTIVDISNPGSPVVLGSLTDPVNLFGAYGVAVQGSFAYVAAQGCLGGQPCPNTKVGNSFAVINVANPASPTLVATIHNSSLPKPWSATNALDHADSVAISGTDAYVTASYSNRLTVINIANPASPQIVASLTNATLQFPVDVAVVGSDAYVADQVGGTSAGFVAVDVSNPASPRVIGSTKSTLLAGAYRVRVRGDFAYIAAVSAHAVDMIDISDPTHPRLAFGLTDANHLWHTTGVDLGPASTDVIATSPFLQTQSNILYPPFPNQGGPANTGTVNAISLIPSPIAVQIATSSEPPLVSLQNSANFAFSANDTVSTPRCQLDGGPFGLCTSATTMSYTGLPLGPHTFAVQAIDAAGNLSAAASYTWTVAGTNTGPSIASVAPASGPKRGGTSVTITGSGFTGATKVRFGSTAATRFTVNSASRITALAPAHAVGAVTVSVTTPAGTSPAAAGDTFTYTGGARDRGPARPASVQLRS